MPKFDLDIPHALQPDEAKARIDRATAKIESAYGATCRWTGEHRLTVSRKGFDAQVDIEATRIHVAVNLAFLLSPMASSIKTGLARELAGLMAAPPSAPPPSGSSPA
jgi:putative polyhydroxyalkanoate system protein